MALIRKGDQQACCALYDGHKRALVRFAYYLSENEKRAQRLTQQAFLDFFKEIKKGELDVAPPIWPYRHVVQSFTAHFQNDEPELARDLSGLSRLAEKKSSHLLAVLTEMSPWRRAQFLIWLLCDFAPEDQAEIFGMRVSQWQRECEKSCLNALYWSEVIELDQVREHP